MSELRRVLPLFLALWCTVSSAGTEPSRSLVARARASIAAGDYVAAESTLRRAVDENRLDSEALYLLGYTLAKREQWAASAEVLSEVVSLDPESSAAYWELAGVQYRLHETARAIETLRRGLRVDPDHDYGNRFLATLLYLEGDRVESLYHWNRIDAPRIGTLVYRVPEGFSPVLADRLFPLNEGEVLRRESILDAQWKESRFRTGTRFFWQLKPQAGDVWEMEIAVSESSSQALRQLLIGNASRALLNREIAVPLRNLGRAETSFELGYRWDEPQKRVRASGNIPFLTGRDDRLGFELELRDELWSIPRSGIGYHYRASSIMAEYETLFQGRRSLTMHSTFQAQRYSMESDFPPEAPNFLRVGAVWRQRFGLNPSERLRLEWTAGIDRFLSAAERVGSSTQGSTTLALTWDADPGRGNSFAASGGGGVSSRFVPYDRYFALGIGQDGSLPLRAHPLVSEGRRGANPIARNYVLTNAEVAWRAFRAHFFDVSVSGFSDFAVVSGAPFEIEVQREHWFHDVGIALQVRGFGQVLLDTVLARDLRSGQYSLWLGVSQGW